MPDRDPTVGPEGRGRHAPPRPGPIRILVADSDPSVERIASLSLRQEGFDVLVESDGQAALRTWEKRRPEVVVLESTLPKINGYDLATRIRAKQGNSHVVIVFLATDHEPEARVRGLRAGGDDYLVKPLHPAELVARVKSLLARFGPAPVRGEAAAGPRPARVIAFYGAKGGVGNTTIAVNTAMALQLQLHRRVVLVDANLQFGVHRLFFDLGLERPSITNLVTSSAIDVDLLKQVLVKHDSGLSLLLAPSSPGAAELVSPDHLPAIIQLLRTLFDDIVLDLDDRLDEINLRLLDVADQAIIVLTADLASLTNVRSFLETVESMGYDTNAINLVLNRSNGFTGINLKTAERALERPITFEIVNDYKAAVTALNAGTPLMLAKANSTLAKSIISFAKQLDKPIVATPVVRRVTAPGS